MTGSMSSQWGLLSVIPVCLTGVPVAYLLHRLGVMENPLYVLITGVICLLTVIIVPTALIVIRGEKHDPIFCFLGIFIFSSVMDIFIGLESEGWMPNFLTFYLLEGEPYLGTPHGTMIVFWDVVAHFIMNSAMIIAECRRVSFLEIGLYWVGSVGHSMFVFMPGNIIGKSGVKWSILLNTPYMVIPYWAGYRLLRMASQQQPSDPKLRPSALWRRPLDGLFVLYLLAALALACFRAMAVLGCTAELAQTYISQYEPYLLDDNGYPKIQMLVYLFYFVPYYVAAICGLWSCPGQPWMVSWSLIHAGAAAQAQFVHIFAGIHPRTADTYRIPSDPDHRLPFYLINGTLFVLPQLLALRCLYARTDKHTASLDIRKSPKEGSFGAHVKKRKHYKQQ